MIEPSEAKIVQRIYAEYLAGKSWKKIIDGLQKDGLKNGAGNTKWWDTNIRQILTNEKYMGDEVLIGEKILKLKKQKEELYTEEASKKENIEAVDSLMLFLESGQIETYTEDLVRRYVQTIRVFDDKVVVLFKAGLEVEVA